MECPVCFKALDLQRVRPEGLLCGHSVCAPCVEGLSERRCPGCRKARGPHRSAEPGNPARGLESSVMRFADAIDRFTNGTVVAAAISATSGHERERRSIEEHMGRNLGLLLGQLKSGATRRRYRDTILQLTCDVEKEIERETGVDNSDAHIESVLNQSSNENILNEPFADIDM